MLVAVLKEKNYEAARGILEAFCKEYGWHEEVDSKTRSIDLNLRSFPQSVARMMTFTLFSRLPEEVKRRELYPIRFELVVCGH